MDKRVVTDILDLGGPVAFDQVGEGAGTYQCICPFCGKDIGDRVHADTYGRLYEKLYDLTSYHVMNTECGDATEMVVCLQDGTLGHLEQRT